MREHVTHRPGSLASDKTPLLFCEICSLLQSKPRGGTVDCKPHESRDTSVFHAVLTMTKTQIHLKFTVRIMDERIISKPWYRYNFQQRHQSNSVRGKRGVFNKVLVQFSSVQFTHSVVSDSLRPQESQHARPPCPSPTPGVHSDSRPNQKTKTG